MPEDNFDRNARAQELAAKYRLPGRLAWLAADPNEDTQKANLQALLEAGAAPGQRSEQEEKHIQALKDSYAAAKARRDGQGMIASKMALGRLGVNLM